MGAAAPYIIAGVGTGISALGLWKSGSEAKKAGEAQKRAAESSAELLDFNAHIADLQAVDAVERGFIDEQRFRQGVNLMVGTQRAGFAGQGVDVSTGSAVDVQADAMFLGELDALSIRTNAAREAWGYQVQAADTRKRAEIARKEGVMMEAAGTSQRNAARIGAIGSIATTAGSLLMQRYGFSQAPQSR